MVHFKKWKKKKKERERKKQAQYGSTIGCSINMYQCAIKSGIPRGYVHFNFYYVDT